MNAPQQLHALGQSLWLDNITRTLVTSGTLSRYIREFSITGITSNPTIFERAIKGGGPYDQAIRDKAAAGKSGEDVFFELALEDLGHAADLLRPVHEATGGVDGWVSLEVSPLLAGDTAGTIRAARDLHARARRPNLYIKIPGTPAGIPAIEESVFAGIPINVTLLFSREQYLAAAEAYMRGIERRIRAGLAPNISSVASMFVSRWDVAIRAKVRPGLDNGLGIAVAEHTYEAYREFLKSSRWRTLADRGARAQRLLWSSTGIKDPAASDTLYVEALAAPETINTMPEETLLAFVDHGKAEHVMSTDAGRGEALLAEYSREGIELDALATELQREGTAAFARSWSDLLDRIAEKIGPHAADDQSGKA